MTVYLYYICFCYAYDGHYQKKTYSLILTVMWHNYKHHKYCAIGNIVLCIT